MKRAQLVFVPTPGMGHLASTVEIAKLLVSRDDGLSITVLVMNLELGSKIADYTKSLSESSSMSGRIRFVDLPRVNTDPARGRAFLITFVEDQKPNIRNAVRDLTAESDSPPVAGFVLDMFCATVADVANEFGVPTYTFFTSNAGFLGLMQHFLHLHEERNVAAAAFGEDPDAEFEVPSFMNPVPVKVLPGLYLDENGATRSMNLARRFTEMKGILVNTFVELESHAVGAVSGGTFPVVYPVGPVLNLDGDIGRGRSRLNDQSSEIVKWLDDQPDASVVFLCFGSMGSLAQSQVKEIARALEQSGLRFLWSLRQPPPPKGKFMPPTDYEDLKEVLSEEFLERTAGVGKVIGWAPQVTILSHPAVGGFVSHCGWNSTLESLWYGVPIATWPLHAEQQLNAFQLVRDFGLAVELKLDYRRDTEMVVSAQEIEEALRELMVSDSDVRRRVKEMSEKSRKALMEGGSSYSSTDRFVHDVMDNIP